MKECNNLWFWLIKHTITMVIYLCMLNARQKCFTRPSTCVLHTFLGQVTDRWEKRSTHTSILKWPKSRVYKVQWILFWACSVEYFRCVQWPRWRLISLVYMDDQAYWPCNTRCGDQTHCYWHPEDASKIQFSRIAQSAERSLQ